MLFLNSSTPCDTYCGARSTAWCQRVYRRAWQSNFVRTACGPVVDPGTVTMRTKLYAASPFALQLFYAQDTALLGTVLRSGHGRAPRGDVWSWAPVRTLHALSGGHGWHVSCPSSGQHRGTTSYPGACNHLRLSGWTGINTSVSRQLGCMDQPLRFAYGCEWLASCWTFG